ncbi:MAG: hypothetical protein GKR89_06260 [Candidatus Latescibacteria bacterium]|nr:hypothetical protein [Candidatus Latescibacterota bacterium]
MPDSYRVAIIGLGGMGHAHAQAVVSHAQCTLVGGAEIAPDNARRWQEAFAVQVFDDYERLLDQTQPDIAIISTQAPQHRVPLLAAAARGIHVFCEKPIALDLTEADEMVAACQHHDVRFAINHIKRGSPYNQHALDLIKQGAIGRLYQINGTNKGGRKAGNELMEMGTHLFDWVRLFGGDVEWAHGHLTQLDGRLSGLEDIRLTQEVAPSDRDAGLVLGERAFTAFRFANGIHAEVQFQAQGGTDDGNYGLDLIGTQGRLALRLSVGTKLFIHRGEHQAPDQPWEPVHLAAEDLDPCDRARDRGAVRLHLQCRMLDDLIAAIQQRRQPFASGADGRDCLEMIHATYQSHRLGARVSMPLTPRTHPLERWRAEEQV